MDILVIGGGGREHALAWRLAHAGHRVVCAPGNPGIAAVAECAAVAIDDPAGLIALARSRAVALVGGLVGGRGHGFQSRVGRRGRTLDDAGSRRCVLRPPYGRGDRGRPRPEGRRCGAAVHVRQR